MKRRPSQITADDFLAPARRAFKRVARKLREENTRLGLPLLEGDNGRLKRTKLSGTSK